MEISKSHIRFSDLRKTFYECEALSEKIKHFAVQMVGCQLVKGIELLNSAPECERSNPVWNDVPADIFSWSYDHWLRRRQTSNLMWLTLMQNRVDKSCLEERKRATDLYELRSLLCETLQRYFSKNLNYAEDDLESVEKFRVVEISVTRESTRRSVDFFREVYRNFAFNFLHRCMVIIRPTLTDRHAESDVVRPIQRRYMLRFQLNTEKQQIFKSSQGENKIEDETGYYLKRTNQEEKCTMLIMSSYHIELQTLRLSMDKWNERYEADSETLDNAIGYKKSNLDKMKNQRKLMEIKLQSYRDKRTEFERKDQEKLEREMRELEERRIAEELKIVETPTKPKKIPKIKNKSKKKMKF